MSMTEEKKDEKNLNGGSKTGFKGYACSITPQAPDINIYLTGVMGNPENYIELFDIMRQVLPQTLVNLYINGPGGNAETCIQFINAMRECKGTVVGRLDGIAMSAHAIVLMASDVIVVNPFTQFMLHHASFGAIDQGTKTIESAIIKEKWLYELISHYYGPLLTEEELKEVRSGVRDTYFTSDELVRRLHKWGVGQETDNGVWVFKRFDYLGYTEEQKQKYIKSVCGDGHCVIKNEKHSSFIKKILGGE